MTLCVGIPDMVLLRIASRTAPEPSLRPASTLHGVKETLEFKAVFSYVADSRTAWDTRDPVQTNIQNQNGKQKRKRRVWQWAEPIHAGWV